MRFSLPSNVRRLLPASDCCRTAESWQEPPNNWLTVAKNAFEFQSLHVIESRSNVAKWRMTQEREHIRCPKIQFPCNHFFNFTKQNETAGNYRKKTTWLIFELSSEIHSEETDSKESSSLAFSICSVNFHFKINISTASLQNEN